MPVIIDGTNGITQAGEFNSDSSFGFKNRIINGAMGIWQRGTTSTSIGYQTADRWSFYADSSRTVAQSSDVPSGFIYSASLSGTGSTGFTQKIESVNTNGLVGNNITISFYLKQTTGSGSNAIALNLYHPTAVDNYSATTQIGSTQNFTTTTGWAQYSATFSSLPSGAANGLQVTIVTNSGSAVVFLLTGVQLEVGSTATSFDYRSIGTETSLCQRYYYKFKSTGSGVDYALGYALSSTGFRDITAFPVTMRTVPSSLEQTGTASDYSIRAPAGTVTCSAVPFYYGGTANVALTEYTVSSGLTTGQGSSSRFANSNAYVAWSAEL